MAEAMSKLLEEYSILSFVKPHPPSGISCAATTLTRDFTKDDVSINMAKPSHKILTNAFSWSAITYSKKQLLWRWHQTDECCQVFLGKALLSSVKGLPTSGNCESEQPEFKNNQIYRGVFPDFFLINEGTAGTTTSSVPSEAEVEETSKTKLKKMAFSIPKESSSGVSPSDTSFLGEKNRSVIIT
ncbi:hypothetical protein JTB14_033123 [Gonioctena quinquepunctata]|nr:hypothetical protein JTB14_033123 [Gonioctena quinquepunctata]